MSNADQYELEFLRWFYANADFGPAHSDVVFHLHEDYIAETGNLLPEGYGDEE